MAPLMPAGVCTDGGKVLVAATGLNSRSKQPCAYAGSLTSTSPRKECAMVCVMRTSII
jgi:hypothetical protein